MSTTLLMILVSALIVGGLMTAVLCLEQTLTEPPDEV